MTGEYIYANGLNISQARKIFRFYFGEFFIAAEKDDVRFRFNVFVKTKIITSEKVLLLSEYVDTEYFDNFWNIDAGTQELKKNKPFHLMFVDPE